MDDRPIGFFDSGMGGITVLEEALHELPRESFIYYGDSLHAPYGGKTPEEVLKLSEDAISFLLHKKCKAIVIACNTATGVAADILREKYAFPIIGIEPALKPASLLAGEGKIAVLATQVALSTPKFHRLMKLYGQDAFPLPCPGLMECVEQGELSGEPLHQLLTKLLSPCKGCQIKAVVLGCTHYPFLSNAIAEHFAPGTPFFDGAQGTARQLKRRLADSGLLSENGCGHVLFFSSEEGKAEKMQQMLKLFHQMKEEPTWRHF